MNKTKNQVELNNTHTIPFKQTIYAGEKRNIAC